MCEESRTEKVYRDLPIPERTDRKDAEAGEGGKSMSGGDRQGRTASGPVSQVSAVSGENGNAPGNVKKGRSPWNYLTEEDLFPNGTGRQDLFSTYGHERARREEKAYQAWKRQIREEGTPSASYAERMPYAYRLTRELLRGTGDETREEGWRILQHFGEMLPDGFTLSGFSPETLSEIRKYYVIVRDLPRTFVAEAFQEEIRKDERMLALMMYDEAEPDQLCEAITEFGRYHGEKSVFFRDHTEDMKQALSYAYRVWADAWEKRNGRPLAEELLGESDVRVWYPGIWARSAPPAAGRDRDLVFQVDPLLTYHFHKGKWTVRQYFPGIFGSRALRERLRQMCRETERLMREVCGFRKLKPEEMNPEFRRLIADAFSGFRKEKARRQRPELQLDMTQLGRIRLDADYTRDQLLEGTENEILQPVGFSPASSAQRTAHMENLPQDTSAAASPEQNQKPGLWNAVRPEDVSAVEYPAGMPSCGMSMEETASAEEASAQDSVSAEEAPSENHAPSEKTLAENSISAEKTPAENPDACMRTNRFRLTEDEHAVLLLLLSGKSPASYAGQHHLYLSVLADSINEKLFDEFGDSVLEETDGEIHPVEDYREDLRTILNM